MKVYLRKSASGQPMSLTLEVLEPNLDGLSYQLVDANGYYVIDEKIERQVHDISFSFLKPSTYFLLVKSNKKETLKTFKISRV